MDGFRKYQRFKKLVAGGQQPATGILFFLINPVALIWMCGQPVASCQ